MSAPATAPVTYDKTRLFWISSLALCMSGIASAIQTNIASDIQRDYLDPIDRLHSAQMTGTVLGVPFLAFAITIAVSSPLLDIVGMRPGRSHRQLRYQTALRCDPLSLLVTARARFRHMRIAFCKISTDVAWVRCKCRPEAWLGRSANARALAGPVSLQHRQLLAVGAG